MEAEVCVFFLCALPFPLLECFSGHAFFQVVGIVVMSLECPWDDRAQERDPHIEPQGKLKAYPEAKSSRLAQR